MYKSIIQTNQMGSAHKKQAALLKEQYDKTAKENKEFEEQVALANRKKNYLEEQMKHNAHGNPPTVMLRVHLRELDHAIRTAVDKERSTTEELHKISEDNEQKHFALLLLEKDFLIMKEKFCQKKEENLKKDARNMELLYGVEENHCKIKELKQNIAQFEDKMKLLKALEEAKREELRQIHLELSGILSKTRQLSDKNSGFERKMTGMRDDNITKASRLHVLIGKHQGNFDKLERIQSKMKFFLHVQQEILRLQGLNKGITERLLNIQNDEEEKNPQKEVPVPSGERSSILVENDSNLINQMQPSPNQKASGLHNIKGKMKRELDLLLFDDGHNNKENFHQSTASQRSVCDITEGKPQSHEIEHEMQLAIVPEMKPQIQQQKSSRTLRSLSEFD